MANSRHFGPRASIVLVGLRGAGKRSLAFIAAAHLRWRFVSEAVYFEQLTGTSKAKFLHKHGKLELNRKSLHVLRQMLIDHQEACVIECGMASLLHAAPAVLREYARNHPVIHVVRELESIAKLLGLGEQDARRLAEADRIHSSSSNFEFYNAHDPTIDMEVDAGNYNPSDSFALRHLQADFCRYVNFILRRNQPSDDGPFSLSAVALESRPHTYVTSINLSEILQYGSKFEWTESGEDAIELVVDTYEAGSLHKVSRGVALLKRVTRVPLLYRVSKDALGRDPSVAHSCYEVLNHGLRRAVDYLVVESTSPEAVLHALVRSRGHTKIIGHHHFENNSSEGWIHPSRTAIFDMAKSAGVNLARLTQVASSRKDNSAVQLFRNSIFDQALETPTLVAYNLGELGKTSLISNQVLSPVHRHLVSVNDCPRYHLTIQEITTALFRCFELDALKYYVVGEDTSYSRSPQMHTAAYRLHGLEHAMNSMNIATFQEAMSLWQQIDFGGSAVSFPYKEQAYQACKYASPHANATGCVNTILPLRLGESMVDEAAERNRAGQVLALYGDNSDWYGVYSNIRRKISPRNAACVSQTTGFVIGAGGSARSAVYALLQFGCRKVVILNRTISNAQKLADHFNDWASTELVVKTPPVRTLRLYHDTWPTDIDLPTMIVACIPTLADAQGFRVPSSWLYNPSGGVVADFNYEPVDTPLLEQVRQHKVSTGQPWATVNGIEILLEQGFLQFEQMTGRRAPRQVMMEALQG